MNELRRNILKGAAASSTVAIAAAAGLLRPGNALADWDEAAFLDHDVAVGMKAAGADGATNSADIIVKAPDIAENGAVVPVEITSNIPDTTEIAIISDKNTYPLVAGFILSNGAEGYVSTRIKMGATAPVRAIVTAGGKKYAASKEVKVTIGGCGG
jgi:sulfur-oxidizing protein SoxY